jgi:hypothetical protein
MGKIEKLNKGIEKLEAKIYLMEEGLEESRKDLSSKAITKAEFTTLKLKNQTKIRGLRTSIGKKEKARMLFEKKYREKAEKKAEKKRKKEQD